MGEGAVRSTILLSLEERLQMNYAARIRQLVGDYNLVAGKDDGKMSKSEHTCYLIRGLLATKDWRFSPDAVG